LDAINLCNIPLLATTTSRSCSPSPLRDFPGEAIGVSQRKKEKVGPIAGTVNLKKRIAAAASLFAA